DSVGGNANVLRERVQATARYNDTVVVLESGALDDLIAFDVHVLQHRVQHRGLAIRRMSHEADLDAQSDVLHVIVSDPDILPTMAVDTLPARVVHEYIALDP